MKDTTKGLRRVVFLALLALSPIGVQATNYWNGLPALAIGQAALRSDPASGRLEVSGIGSGGGDGVRIDTGGSDSATTRLGTFDLDRLPIDAFLQWAAIDPTGAPVEQVTYRRVAAGGAVFADFTGLGAPRVTVALYSNDVLLAYVKGVPSTAPVFTFSGGTAGGDGRFPIALDPCILHPDACYGVIDIDIWRPGPIGPVGSRVALPGQVEMRGTRVQIQPEPLPAARPALRVAEVQITGRSLGSLILEDASLVYWGLEHRALGQAQFSYDAPDQLMVGNLGPSGEDGVEVQLQRVIQGSAAGVPIVTQGPPRNAYSASWVALNPQPLPPGGDPRLGLMISARGRLDGGPEQLLARVGQMFTRPGLLTAPGENLAPTELGLVPDFSAMGSRSQEVQLWRDGTLLTRYRVDNNFTALTTPHWLNGMQIIPASGGIVPPYGPICFYGDWPILVEVTTPWGERFQVNQVRLAIDDIGVSLDALTRVSFQFPGPQSLVLTRESARRVGLNFNGNQHFALGGAILSKNAAGELVLDHTGESGLDGMEIALGNAGYGEVASPSLPLPPPGNSCRYDYRAVVDDLADRTAAVVTMSHSAEGEMLLTGDMSGLGATRYTLMVLDGDTQVAMVTNQPAAAVSVRDSAVSISPSLRWDIQRYKCFILVKLPKLPGNPGPLLQIRSGSPVRGDSVIILPENPSRTLGAQSRILLTASEVHPEPKRFLGEALGMFGLGHAATGRATLTALGGTLTVGNLGLSGHDGVDIDLQSSRNFLSRFAPIRLPAVQDPDPSPWLEARAFGEFGGLPNRDLGSLRFTVLGPSAVKIEADFSSVGADTHTVEVWRGGQMVERVTGHRGVVAQVNHLPVAVGKLGNVNPGQLPCYISPFGALVPVAIGGGPTVEGDEVRVLTENASATLGSLQRLALRGRGLDSITLVGATRTPALSPRVARIERAMDGSLLLATPTAFGYNYTLEAKSALDPDPSTWRAVETLFGDGSVKVFETRPIPIPNASAQFFRLRVD